jgi:hypothetical protein
MLSHRHRRTWKDADTYLVLALLVVALGAAIAQHAMIPANWVVLEEAVRIHAVVPEHAVR